MEVEDEKLDYESDHELDQKAEERRHMTTQQLEIKKIREELPIYQYKQEIIELVKDNDFCVITGDTGSGKSTQLPQYIRDSQEIKEKIFGKIQTMNVKAPQIKQVQDSEEITQESKPQVETNKPQNYDKKHFRIVITQPRRVATISMAKRMCYERQVKLGEEVGYTIRFDDKSSDHTYLKYVTDGILVREILMDRDLSQYSVVILDEAHERSLQTDILFALVKQAIINRKGGLKLIVTSATLNTDQFRKYFNNCPLIAMKGRSYPVEIKYNTKLMNRRVDDSVKAAIRMHLHEGPGDVLVFLTGKDECENARRLCQNELIKLAKERPVAAALIYTLYGIQHHDEQQQVFQNQKEHTRKIIFSTNIAETSITIDGIGFVIDSGYVKQKQYNAKTGMDALIVVPISQVQAIQRTGRAGRTQDGKCFRLYSEQFYNDQMPKCTIPEILRVNLANVILQLKNMNIADVLNFQFMEKPDQDTILSALKQLFLLDAIDDEGNITELGIQMCRFPLEPSYAKALLTAVLFNVEEKMISLVSLLSSENLWAKPPRVNDEQCVEFDQRFADFVDLDGDHETLLKVMNRWRNNNYSEGFCKYNYLNSRALKQAQNISLQLKDLVKGANLKNCMKYYEKDPIYLVYKKSKKSSRDKLTRHPKHGHDKKYKKHKDKYRKYSSDESDQETDQTLTPSLIFRLAISSGFYFNSAKQVYTIDGAYLPIFNEAGHLVEIDPQSIYQVTEVYPTCLVYTELGGNSASKGVIRLCSEIKIEWVKGYMEKYNSTNIFRLAGIKNDRKRVLDQMAKNDDQKQLSKEDKAKEREQKKQEALQKYQERKKLKK